MEELSYEELLCKYNKLKKKLEWYKENTIELSEIEDVIDCTEYVQLYQCYDCKKYKVMHESNDNKNYCSVCNECFCTDCLYNKGPSYIHNSFLVCHSCDRKYEFTNCSKCGYIYNESVDYCGCE